MVRKLKSVGNGSYNGFAMAGEENRWETSGRWLGIVSVRMNGNKGRERKEGYLRVPPVSFAFFCESKNFVERTSGVVVFFRAAALDCRDSAISSYQQLACRDFVAISERGKPEGRKFRSCNRG